jgi:rRNA maturation protein Nop10
MQLLMPKCPGGGTYTLGTLEVVPKCSIGGNSSLAADDDHMILN